MIIPLSFRILLSSFKALVLSFISVIVPSTQEDTIKSILLSSIFILDKLEHINLVLSFLLFSFALESCLSDKSIPMYSLLDVSKIFKNLPVPHPASNTILSFEMLFR